MTEKGWICLHREITDWQWYQDSVVKSVFIHCLLKASYEDRLWQGYEIKRGEFITSISSLAEELGITVNLVRSALDKLEKCGAIIKKSTNRFTLIKCCNYSLFQDINDGTPQTNHKQNTNETQTKHKQITTTNNINNNNNYNNNNKYRESRKFNLKKLGSSPSFDIEEIKRRAALNDDFDI